jgi:hypothetical protein
MNPTFMNVLLIALSVATLAGTGVTLFWFFRRLTRIEEERWGRAMGYGRPSFLLGFRRRRAAETDESPPADDTA